MDEHTTADLAEFVVRRTVNMPHDVSPKHINGAHFPSRCANCGYAGAGVRLTSSSGWGPPLNLCGLCRGVS